MRWNVRNVGLRAVSSLEILSFRYAAIQSTDRRKSEMYVTTSIVSSSQNCNFNLYVINVCRFLDKLCVHIYSDYCTPSQKCGNCKLQVMHIFSDYCTLSQKCGNCKEV